MTCPKLTKVLLTFFILHTLFRWAICQFTGSPVRLFPGAVVFRFALATKGAHRKNMEMKIECDAEGCFGFAWDGIDIHQMAFIIEWHPWDCIHGMTFVRWHSWNDIYWLTCIKWHFFDINMIWHSTLSILVHWHPEIPLKKLKAVSSMSIRIYDDIFWHPTTP